MPMPVLDVRLLTALTLGALLAGPGAARASHMTTAITVAAAGKEARGVSHQQERTRRAKTQREVAGKLPVLVVKPGEHIQLRWYIKNLRPTKLEKIIVHTFVKTEAEADQPEAMDPTRGAVWESAFVQDFTPGESLSGQLDFQIAKPGDYIAQIETRNSPVPHEHFSRVRIHVE